MTIFNWHKNKAKICEFGRLEDSLTRDRTVCGIDSKEMRERLIRDSKWTLKNDALVENDFLAVMHERNLTNLFMGSSSMSLPIGTNGKLLAAIGKFPHVPGKLIIG